MTFSNNAALHNGGAIFFSIASVVSFRDSSQVYFFNNSISLLSSLLTSDFERIRTVGASDTLLCITTRSRIGYGGAITSYVMSILTFENNPKVLFN